VDDNLRRLAELMASPLGEEIDLALAWAQEHGSGGELEIFLHPDDAGPVAGGEYEGCPIRQSIGVPLGRVLVFDREAGRYIRRGEQP
jgi:hypothetical protein